MRHRHLIRLCAGLLLAAMLPGMLLHAQESTPSPTAPVRITATAGADAPRARVLVDSNLWGDPLVRDSRPVTSLASGSEVTLLGINPRGDRYRILAYNEPYWIAVDSLEIISETVTLPVIAEITPTITPTADLPTLTPTLPASASVFLPGDPMGYGGLVTRTDSERALPALREAAMDWMKIVTQFEPGMDADPIIAQIESAHDSDFKLLITLTGDADALDSVEGYADAYAQFAGDLAAAGADGIEIWQQPNRAPGTDSDPLSAITYVDSLLRPAFAAIKLNNPDTIVISAGLFSDTDNNQDLDDRSYLRNMVTQGALRALDCIGMHYTGGMVAPQSTRGDIRDDSYARYLPSLLETYRDLTGFQKPLCLTELGYYSNDGLDRDLPDNFIWARNIDRSDQATWHTQARSYAQDEGYIQLLLVNNVNFTPEDDETAAAYALLRGDDCPACEQLGRQAYLDSLPEIQMNDSTNVRRGASIDFQPPLGSVSRNSRYKITAVNPDAEWVRVIYNGEGDEGWIQVRFGTLYGSLRDVPITQGPEPPDITSTPRPRPTETPTPTLTPTPSPTVRAETTDDATSDD